jgi:LmbE family N-acetylglucosaminyl deacetylase
MAALNDINGKEILIVVAHPDDETLGAGSTIARLGSENNKISVACFTNGVGSRDNNDILSVDERKMNSELAAKELGFNWVYAGDFPDNSLDTVPFLKIVKIIEAIKCKLNPMIIFTHSSADLNIDHRIISQATYTAFRPLPGEVATEILSMEIPSATDFGHESYFGSFQPNVFVDADFGWQAKMRAIKAYANEIYESPHSRSMTGIEALATVRGHQVGLNKAEAFQSLRRIIR